MGADKPHRPRQIQSALLLGVGTQAVIHNKALVAQPAQRFCNRGSLVLIAAELERTARADEHRAFDFGSFRNGEAGKIGSEIRIIRITAVIFRIFRDTRHIAFLPQIQNLLRVRRYGCCRHRIFRAALRSRRLIKKT